MKTKTRRNSLESLNSSSESIEESDSEEDEQSLLKTLLKGQQTLQSVVAFKGSGEKKLFHTFPHHYDHFHFTKSKLEQSPVLCSIPEADVVSTKVERCDRDSLSISTEGHQLPILLENKKVQEDHIEEREISNFSSIWSLLTILSFISRCLVAVICISTLFVVFVILTHQHSRYLSEKDPYLFRYLLPTCSNMYLFILHFRIEREAALEFCTKDEDEDLIEAHSPTAPLDGLNDVLREIEVNSPPTLQPEIIAPATSDYNNDPDKEAIEERYIVKAVPMTAPHKEELIGEELEKTESDQDDNGDDSSTNETIDQDEEPELEEVKDSKVENDPEAAIPSTTHQPPPSSALNEAEIPSFGEWKQKALEEEQKKREEEKRKKEDEKKKLLLVNNAEGGKGSKEFNKTNGGLGGLFTKDSVAGSTVSGGLKKNFASLDCGAKIAAANAESASASNIFTTSRDEYMRNACSDQAWFIVELCESIKALKIEIANHELYSSVFKDFRVSLSNVFPGRDKDWTLFGTFEAKDERFSQAFVSDSDHGVFGKYVKVEILSHHGNEYFCPISSFKIYGVSEIELIGADDDDDDDDHDHDHDNVDFHHVSPAQPTSESTDARDDSMVFNVIKATFRIIAGVFAPNEQVKNLDMSHALNQSSLEGFTFLYEISCPSCDDNRLRDVYFLLAFNYAQLSHTLARNQGLKQALARNVCQYYGFNVQEDKSNKEATSIQSGFRMVEFYATLFGSSQIMALCNLISIASGSSPTVQSPIVLPPWKTRPYEATSTDTVNDTSKAEIIISKNHDQKHPSLVPPKETEAIVAADPILSSKSLLPDASFSKSSSIVSKPVVTETVKTFTGDKQMNVDSSVTSVIPSVTAKISSIPSSSQPPPSSSSSPSSPSSASKPKIDPTPASPSQSSQEPLKDPPDVVIVPPAATSNSDSNGQSSNTGGGGTPSQVQSQGQRESVWQKLSNKIKSLERNVSLSSGYLEELSVQYKKQIEDLQLAVRQSGEALSAASKAREYDRNQVKDLKEEIGQLKVVVEEVSTRMETMSTWVST